MSVEYREKKRQLSVAMRGYGDTGYSAIKPSSLMILAYCPLSSFSSLSQDLGIVMALVLPESKCSILRILYDCIVTMYVIIMLKLRRELPTGFSVSCTSNKIIT